MFCSSPGGLCKGMIVASFVDAIVPSTYAMVLFLNQYVGTCTEASPSRFRAGASPIYTCGASAPDSTAERAPVDICSGDGARRHCGLYKCNRAFSFEWCKWASFFAGFWWRGRGSGDRESDGFCGMSWGLTCPSWQRKWFIIYISRNIPVFHLSWKGMLSMSSCTLLFQILQIGLNCIRARYLLQWDYVVNLM